MARSRRQRRGAHGKQLRACSVGPAGTDGSDAVRKGRLPTRPSGWSAQATVHEAEGALGDGRRPGPAQVVVFDEAAADGGPGGTAARSSVSTWQHAEGPGSGVGSRQRTSEVTSRSRFAADNAVAGRRSTEELPIEAPPGPCGALFLTSDRGSGSGHTSGLGRRRWPKLEGRRQATLHPKVRRRPKRRRWAGDASRGTRWSRRPRGRGLWRVVREGASPGGRSRKGLRRERSRSGIGWSVLGARGRKSVAEVGKKHLSP